MIGWRELVECGGYVPARDRGRCGSRAATTSSPTARSSTSGPSGQRLLASGSWTTAPASLRLRRRPATTRASTSRPAVRGGGQGIWIRHTVHKRPGAEPERLDLVHPLRCRGAGAAGDQGHRARLRALRAAGLLDPGRRSRDRPRPRRGLGRDRRLRRLLAARPSAATTSPASTCRPTGSTRRRCRRRSSSRPTRTPASAAARGRRRDDRARGLAGDDRPQLGLRARRALGLAGGDGLRRRAGRLLRRRRGADPARALDDRLDPVRDADARRRAPSPRRRRALRSAEIGESARRPASSSFPARTWSCGVGSRRRAKDFVGWVYADPDGPEHNTVNCSIADLELTVERDGQPAADARAGGRRRV